MRVSSALLPLRRVLAWIQGTPWAALALLLYAAACAVTARYGRVTLDEGWYLYAGSLVWRGQLPYRDFLFSQVPLSAYLLAPLSIFGPHSYGAARLLWSAMGFAAIVLTVRSAWIIGGRGAAIIVAALFCANVAFCFDTCTVKTAAPAALLLAAAFHELARKPGAGGWANAAALLSVAVGVRLSVLPILVLVLAAGVQRCWREPFGVLRIAAAAVVPMLLILGPFWGIAWDRFWFDVVQYHNVVAGSDYANPSMKMVSYFVRGVILNQGVAILLGGIALCLWVNSALTTWREKRILSHSQVLCALALASYGSVTLLHVTRSLPYPTHQTMLLPLLVLGVALQGAEIVAARRWAKWVALAAVVSVPLQEWPLRFGESGNLKGLEKAATVLEREAAGRGLITFDPALAVVAGLKVVPGCEMGMFGYLPGFAMAEQYHAKNEANLLADLSYGSSTVALTTFDLQRWILRKPGGEAIVQELMQEYVVREVVPNYGQFAAELVIFTRR